MKFTSTKESLIKGMGQVGRIVGQRTTLPILSHVLISAEGGQIKIAATDLEIGVVATIEGNVEQDGQIALPARLLGEFVNSNPDKSITLVSDKTAVKASSDHVKATLNGMDPVDFPLIPEVETKTPIAVKAADLKEAISQVAYACAIDESRPVLMGVLMKIEKDELVLAATDSYRLAEKKLKLAIPVEQNLSVIVPSRTLQEVGRIIEKDDVTLAIADNRVGFTFNQATLVSRILEGSFPDYAKIIPQEKSTTLTISNAKLASILKLGSTFAREVSNNIKLVVNPGEPLKIIATSPHVGETTATVEAEIKGKDLEIAFNAKFLLDVLSVIGSDEIKIDFNGSLAAAIIQPVKGSDYRALVMPLKLDEI